MKVVVTGASGFVGQALMEHLLECGDEVIAVSRSEPLRVEGVSWIAFEEFLACSKVHLSGVQAVYHLAGRAHVKSRRSQDLNQEWKWMREANTQLTRRVAEATFAHSGARLVLLSTIGVHGQSTPPGVSLHEESPFSASSPYAVSKLDAEVAVMHAALAWGGAYAIVRAPLVYGGGAPANFGALARVAKLPLPLPFGEATEERAMIGVRNLAVFLRLVATHPGAGNRSWVIADDPPQSTRSIVGLLRAARGAPDRLVKVSPQLLRGLFRLVGRADRIEQLFGALAVDIRRAREDLGWYPPYPPIDNLRVADLTTRPLPHSLNTGQRLYLSFRGFLERALAAMMLLALAPLLLSVALAIVLQSPGKPLFVQQRAGQHHRPFRIYKFRTMRVGTPALSTEEMQRSGLNPTTGLGVWLRRTSLDELPQLVNVVRGEMSLVGPRPALLTQEVVLRGRERAGVHQLRPGITGLAQITGRDDLPDAEKIRRDTTYLRHLGPATDLILLLYTLRRVVKARGAY